MSQHEATVTLGPLEDMRVRFEYTKGSPGRMYMPNGDPGYPPEPDELYITHVQVRGQWLPASAFEAAEDWLTKAEDDLMERQAEREDAERAEAAEREYDEQNAPGYHP